MPVLTLRYFYDSVIISGYLVWGKSRRIYKQASCRGWTEALPGILLKEMSKYTKHFIQDSRCPAEQAASN